MAAVKVLVLTQNPPYEENQPQRFSLNSAHKKQIQLWTHVQKEANLLRPGLWRKVDGLSAMTFIKNKQQKIKSLVKEVAGKAREAAVAFATEAVIKNAWTNARTLLKKANEMFPVSEHGESVTVENWPDEQIRALFLDDGEEKEKANERMADFRAKTNAAMEEGLIPNDKALLKLGVALQEQLSPFSNVLSDKEKERQEKLVVASERAGKLLLDQQKRKEAKGKKEGAEKKGQGLENIAAAAQSMAAAVTGGAVVSLCSAFPDMETFLKALANADINEAVAKTIEKKKFRKVMNFQGYYCDTPDNRTEFLSEVEWGEGNEMDVFGWKAFMKQYCCQDKKV